VKRERFVRPLSQSDDGRDHDPAQQDRTKPAWWVTAIESSLTSLRSSERESPVDEAPKERSESLVDEVPQGE